MSPCPFGSISGRHLSGPISCPLLGQRTNQSTEECFQGNGETASETMLKCLSGNANVPLTRTTTTVGDAGHLRGGAAHKKAFPVLPCISHNPPGAHEHHRHCGLLCR